VSAELPRQFGPYVLLEKLGQGGMGDIHLARPTSSGRGVPSPSGGKRRRGERADNPNFVQRFRHEAELAVSIDNDHVARVFDVGAVNEALYIAMEHVTGWPLTAFIRSVIESRRHASVSSIVELFVGGLEGLHAIHTAKDTTGQPLGVVHRDISPKNLMVGDDGSMRIIDLGLGKSNAQDWKTRTGVVMGSVGYMPPEQVMGEKVDARADLYSFGVVLFEMLSLRLFIPRGPLADMFRASLEPTRVPPSKFRDDVPPPLDAIVMKALQPAREDRYQTAGEFLDDLRGVVPRRSTRGSMHSLLGELFGDSLIQRRREISQLLTMAVPLSDDEPEMEKTRTVVFVQRPGVRPLSAEDLVAATAISAGSDGSLMPTAVATRATQVHRPSAAPLASLPPPRGGLTWQLFAGTIVVTLAVGVAIGAGLLAYMRRAPEPATVVAPTNDLVPAAGLRASPGASAPSAGAPSAEAPSPANEDTAAPATTKTAPKPASTAKPATTARRPRRTKPTPPEPKPAAAPAPSASALLKRANTLRAKLPADSAAAGAVNELRVKISMEASSPNASGSAARLAKIRDRLMELERAAP